MSIILAGLYDNGAGVVVVADKARTAIDTQGKEIVFEREDIRKIIKISTDLYLLLAGETAISVAFCRDIEDISHNSTLEEVIEKAEERYKFYKNQNLEEKVLNKQ